MPGRRKEGRGTGSPYGQRCEEKFSTGGAYGVASGSRLLFRPRRVVGETFEVVVAVGQEELGRLYLSIVRWFDVTLGGSPFKRQFFIRF